MQIKLMVRVSGSKDWGILCAQPYPTGRMEERLRVSTENFISSQAEAWSRYWKFTDADFKIVRE